MIKKVILSVVALFVLNTSAFANVVPYNSLFKADVMAEFTACGITSMYDRSDHILIGGTATADLLYLRPDGSVYYTLSAGTVIIGGGMMSDVPNDSVDCTANNGRNGGDGSWSDGVTTTVKISSQAPVGTNLKLCRIGLKQVHASELLIDNQIVKAVSSDGSGYEVYDINVNIPPSDIHVKFGGARYNAGYYLEYCWYGHPLVDTGYTWLGYNATFLSSYDGNTSTTAEGYLTNSEPELSSELIACGYGTLDNASQAITDLTLMSHPQVGLADNGSNNGTCSLRIKYDETADTPRSSSLQTGWLQVTPGVASHADGNI